MENRLKVIAICNQKGGVGKTTSTVNIAAGLIQLKKKVLIIDLDSQASATYSLGILAHELQKSVYGLIKKDYSLNDVLIEKDGFKIIPAALDLSGAERELIDVTGREFLLKEALARVKDLDYILIDSPPSLGLLTINALTAAGEVYIPLQTEFLALQGLSKLLETVEVVKKRLNPGLEITGIIGTRYDKRRNLNREVIEKIQGHFKDKLFNTLIRENIALAEAPSFGQNIFSYRPNSYGAEDYLNLCKEIIERGEM